MGPWQRYGQSKLANILYTAELARRYPEEESGIKFASLHPGIFNTGMVKQLSWGNKAMVWVGTAGNMKNESKEGEGAWNTCWAATSKRDGVVSGEFYMPVGVKGMKLRAASSKKLAGKLWEWTQKELEGWN